MFRYAIPSTQMLATSLVAAPLVALLLSTATLGQTPSPPPEASAPDEPIPTEVLVAPRPPKMLGLSYPQAEMERSGEGWVNLGFMVSPTGQPFEVTVTASSGNKNFERVAIDAIERATFKPGLLNGQPIESATEFKVVFSFAETIKGARREFVDQYRTLQKAINAKDRSAADAALKHLDVNNLYEDAYFGLATYAYAREWGDETQQLAGLQRAAARESSAHYLPRSDFLSVQLESLVLDVKLHHYAEAMALWSSLLKADTDPALIDKLKPMVQQLDHIRLAGQAYEVAGSMPDGTWRLDLFEPNFRIHVAQGHLSQVKLRCAKGFVRFTFDPDIEYKVATKYGSCNIELDGDPGTSFTLTQS